MRPEADAPANGSAAERIGEILAERRYQTELPQGPPEPPDWSLPMGLGSLINAALIAAGIVAVALLVIWTVQRIVERRRIRAGGGSTAAPGEGELPAWAALRTENPEDLAGRGRFDEAIHALLLRALQERVAATRASFSDALTSRELVRALQPDPSAGDAFNQLIGEVERAWLGGFPVDETAYRRCRDHYRVAVGTEPA